jgi:hypothetical protein
MDGRKDDWFELPMRTRRRRRRTGAHHAANVGSVCRPGAKRHRRAQRPHNTHATPWRGCQLAYLDEGAVYAEATKEVELVADHLRRVVAALEGPRVAGGPLLARNVIDQGLMSAVAHSHEVVNAAMGQHACGDLACTGKARVQEDGRHEGDQSDEQANGYMREEQPYPSRLAALSGSARCQAERP